MKTKIILGFVILTLLISVGSYKYFFNEAEQSYSLAVVEKGAIIQEVSVTGTIKPAQRIDLQFETQGRIKEIKVKVGDRVVMGQVLAVLVAEELATQVKEAMAVRDVAQAKLDQILAGANKEEIKVYETAVDNAEIALTNSQTSLKNVEQSLVDTEIDAENDLNHVYEDAQDILDSSYTTADKALLRTFNQIQEEYFNSSDQFGSRVREAETKALSVLQESNNYEDIDSGLTKLKIALSQIREALTCIREAMDEPQYKNTVSAADRTSIDTERVNVDAAVVNLTTIKQTIDQTKIANQTNINNAQASLDTAQSAFAVAGGNLQSAQDKLTQLKAPARQEDIDLAKAQLNQTNASLLRTRQHMAKANLIAPISGTITRVKKEKGEMVKTMLADSVISMISSADFQIEADIPESDIGKLKLGQSASITLDAFPEQYISAKVIEIEPAETIIQGVVYYRIKLCLDQIKEWVKSGMTANIIITANSRNNVLIIPQRAVKEKEGRKTVRVPINKTFREVAVETGLRGSDGMIEIISGLNEGDKVITFIQKSD